MTTAYQGVRILPRQSTAAKARQALMIAEKLGVLTYRGGHQMADPDQRDALAVTVREEFGASISMPDTLTGSHVYYLVVVRDEPVLIPEEDALLVAFGIVLAAAGIEAAREVSYRPHMLPDPSS